MKNSLYHKIISSAIIALCIPLLTCGDFEEGKGGLVWINPGTFTMGDDDTASEHAQPAHQVTLTKGFWMSRYQITQEQFYSVMGKTQPWFKTHGSCLPVDKPTWYQAIVFCNKLSIKEGFTPAYEIQTSGAWSTDTDTWGNPPESWNASSPWNAVRIVAGSTGYRLPTEAQWEYACRAGTTTAFNTGDTISTDQACFDFAYAIYVGVNPSTGKKIYKDGTTPVGKFSPNAWGLYDMHGNVYEWCWDWFADDYTSSDLTDPSRDVRSTNNSRVIRGGSWGAPAVWLRSALRISMDPHGSSDDIFVGFRVVRP